jgi:hypothetical protein
MNEEVVSRDGRDRGSRVTGGYSEEMNVHVGLGKPLASRCGIPLVKKEVAVMVKIAIDVEGAMKTPIGQEHHEIQV